MGPAPSPARGKPPRRKSTNVPTSIYVIINPISAGMTRGIGDNGNIQQPTPNAQALVPDDAVEALRGWREVGGEAVVAEDGHVAGERLPEGVGEVVLELD